MGDVPGKLDERIHFYYFFTLVSVKVNRCNTVFEEFEVFELF